jgi:5-formyltetrahydrofolate cyclo-ligase
MTKSELRKLYLQKRLSLTEGEYSRLSQQISQQFFSNIDLSPTKVIHTYLPIAKNREPNTWLIIDRIRKDFPKIRISLPKVRNNILENFYFEELRQLEKNEWDILEPKHGEITPAENIDVVIVPLVAFDQTGSRVGYGKGFYDKFLALCRADCKKIGLSFFNPVDRIDDTQAFDMGLTHCLTPTDFYQFKDLAPADLSNGKSQAPR